ncbi:MAG: sugar-transfer associated ATP-grasp domain-containing protein [Lachnospiraceae bacterium]|nr:sugar-transfer associated ATP-grasp domain-containing protein [Lachnospiraceae bacterium]
MFNFLKFKKKEITDKNIKKVCEATGWKEKKAKLKMDWAKEKGVSYWQYASKAAYDLTNDEIVELGRAIKAYNKIIKQNQKFYINIVCEKTGWDYAHAKEEMDKAKKNGIPYVKFIKKRCWEVNDQRKQEIANFNKKDKKRITNNKEMYLQKIMDATGWSRGKTELEVAKAKAICEVTYEDYYAFKFYNLSPDEQKNYLTFGLFDKMRLKYNDGKAAKIFADKGGFNEIFADLNHHRWFINHDLSYEDFLKNIEGLNAIIVKPLSSTQGKGVTKFECNISEEKNRKLYDTVMGLNKSIIEEYIIQHEEVMKFCPTSVNTIRITTLNYENECHFLYAVFRMGRGDVVDNFHAGGIAATVDVNTGIVTTDAADLDGNTYPVNPYSGVKIKGFQIPHWDKVIEACKKANGRIEGVNLVGWDFAITEDGAELIEGNPIVSYILAQIPNVADKIGLKPVMYDPYM